MKRLLLGIALLSFGLTASAQDMAKIQGESIATYLGLNASQKQSVIKIYKADEDRKAKKREEMMAKYKPSKEDLAAREKAEKSQKNNQNLKRSGKHGPKNSDGSPSRMVLRIAHRKAELNPSMQQELKKVFTKSQFAKWQELGKK